MSSHLQPLFGRPHLNYIADVLKATVALYMEDESLPMPTHEEVLVCNEHTTEEEIILLWKRAVGDPKYFRIFSLVHAEKLSYQTCDKALKALFDITQGQKGYIHICTCTLNNHIWSFH